MWVKTTLITSKYTVCLDLRYDVYSSQIIKLLCVCLRHGILRQVPDSFLFVHKSRLVISPIFETIKQWRENGWLGNPWILICQHNEIERGGGDGNVQGGKWLQTCVRRKLFFFPFFYTVALIYCPPMWTWWEQLTAKRLVIAASLDATAREMPLAEAVFQVSLPPEENPQASDRLCYDHISRQGLLPNQSGSGLWPKPCTGRFYMESKLRNTGSRYIKALNHIE